MNAKIHNLTLIVNYTNAHWQSCNINTTTRKQQTGNEYDITNKTNKTNYRAGFKKAQKQTDRQQCMDK